MGDRLMKRVQIPVTVTYTGYYEFQYVDTFDLDAIMNEELEASPENKEKHWMHGLKKLRASITEEIEESGVYDVLDDQSIKCDITVGLGPDVEQRLRAIFDSGYAEFEETPGEGVENEL
jgi:hypothetical protein